MGRRGVVRRKEKRKEKARRAQAHLGAILDNPSHHEPELLDVASEQMWKIATRHRVGLPQSKRHWLCRSCHTHLRPGENARVRIRNNMRVTTCLGCGSIRRFGPGKNPQEESE